MVDSTRRPHDGKYNQNDEKGLLNRRSYLKLSAAAVASVGASGVFTGTSSASTHRDDFQFDRTLHAVDDLGMDPTGSEPISGTLESAAADNTLIEFPDGEFLMDFADLRMDLDNFGLAATDEGAPALRHAPSNEERPLGIMIYGSNLLFEGFEMDVSGSGRGRRIHLRAESGTFVVNDIHIVGLWDTWAYPFRVRVLDESQDAYMKNIVANDGQITDHDVSANPVKTEVEHAGDLYVEDCEFSHWGKAIYDPSSQREPLSRGFDVGDGNLHVRNCFFHNNNAASIRTGSGSTIRNCEFRVDDSTEGETVTWKDPVPNRQGIVNARAIRCKGDLGETGVLIEDCKFVYTHPVSGGGIITSSSVAGGHTVRNCSIRCESTEIYPILLKDDSSETGPTTFENVTITGTGGDSCGAFVWGRDGTTFENCCIDLGENGQDGVYFYESTNGNITDSNINVPADAFVYNDSSGSTENVTYSSSCSTGDSGSSDDSGSTEEYDLTQTLTVRGTGEAVDYTVETTEGIVYGPDGSTVTDPDTVVSDTVAADGEDWYWWDGEIVSVSLSGPAEFYVNGEKVDPDSLGLPNSIVLQGRNGESDYEFTVSGDLQKSELVAPTEKGDIVDGSTADGAVGDDADGYRFSGNLTELTINGDANVRFE